MEEVAEVLEISVATVGREQRLVEVWLKRYMAHERNMCDLSRWREVEDLFHQALEYPEAERQPWLIKALRRDASLLDEMFAPDGLHKPCAYQNNDIRRFALLWHEPNAASTLEALLFP